MYSLQIFFINGIVSSPQSTRCTVLNSMAISCVTPPLTRMQSGDSDGVNYTILIDNAPGPDLTMMSLQINVLPNPGNFKLVDNEYNIGSGTAIRIMVRHLTITKGTPVLLTFNLILCVLFKSIIM